MHPTGAHNHAFTSLGGDADFFDAHIKQKGTKFDMNIFSLQILIVVTNKIVSIHET